MSNVITGTPYFLLVNTNTGRAHAETEAGTVCGRNPGECGRYAVMDRAGIAAHLSTRVPNPCPACVAAVTA